MTDVDTTPAIAAATAAAVPFTVVRTERAGSAEEAAGSAGHPDRRAAADDRRPPRRRRLPVRARAGRASLRLAAAARAPRRPAHDPARCRGGARGHRLRALHDHAVRLDPGLAGHRRRRRHGVSTSCRSAAARSGSTSTSRRRTSSRRSLPRSSTCRRPKRSGAWRRDRRATSLARARPRRCRLRRCAAVLGARHRARARDPRAPGRDADPPPGRPRIRRLHGPVDRGVRGARRGPGAGSPPRSSPGIGFLGAGAILKEGATIRGLTTAASLWAVAAVGMAAGAGAWLVAVAPHRHRASSRCGRSGSSRSGSSAREPHRFRIRLVTSIGRPRRHRSPRSTRLAGIAT